MRSKRLLALLCAALLLPAIALAQEEFEGTASGQWLAANAHNYGFIMRYPQGKDAVTGYSYEPWHYRYVGVDYATAIFNAGLSFEEYFGVPGGDYCN